MDPRARAAFSSVFLMTGVLSIFGPTCGQAGPGPVQAEPIRRLQSILPEEARTHILVLATFHFRTLEKTFEPGLLDGLVAALERFKPDAICIENLPGPRVHELELRRAAGPLYAEILDSFAAEHLSFGKPALDLLRTTQPAATNKVRELLTALRSKTPPDRGPDERATLVLWMLAAYEPNSALLQWSYLGEEARRRQKTIPAELAARLDAALARVNEGPALAVRLARQTGLEVLDPVDDFEDLDVYPAILPQLEKDFAANPQFAATSKAPVYIEAQKSLEACVRAKDLSPHFRLLNSPAYGTADADAQWGVFLRTRLPTGTDRARLSLWENRNLKIAAKIKAIAAIHPGGRILVIYGAAHKPFLEAYLSQTADLVIVPFDRLMPPARSNS